MPFSSDLKSTTFLFKRFLKPYWKIILFLVITNIIVGFLATCRPLVIAPALDAFLGKKSIPVQHLKDLTLNNLGATMIHTLHLDINNIMGIGILVAILYLIFSILLGGLSFWSFVNTTKVRSSITHEMVVSLHQHLLTLPLAFFQKRRAGELLSRMNTDVIRTASFLDNIIKSMFQSLAQIIITLCILFRTDVLFSFVLIGLGSIHIFITKMLGEKVKNRAKNIVDMFGVYNANLLESFIGIRLIKSYAAEKFDSNKITRAAKQIHKHEIRFTIIRHIDEPLRVVADGLIIGIILILVFYAVTSGRLTLQASLMFFYLSQQLLSPVSNFANNFLGFQNMIGGASSVIDLFNTKNTIPNGTRQADKIQDKIIIKDVDFSYEKNSHVLKNINLTIHRGEMVALVGPSGSGKSTLVDLILRFYDVDKGSITYDGIDIRSFNQFSYRRNFGVVAQESLLFNATVRENIIYNRPEDEENLFHAIWAANAEEFIKSLPKGLDTFVGDRGIRLSGGQKQRIAIARAIYSRPSILLLDEATSALDSESEQAVQEAINRISKNITSIIIAHRLSTITQANKIVVLTGGEIEAIGSHDIVYEQSPTYRKLYNIQYESLDK